MLVRQIFSKLKTLVHEPFCVKNNFYPETVKNDNGSVAMTFLCVTQTEAKNVSN